MKKLHKIAITASEAAQLTQEEITRALVDTIDKKIEKLPMSRAQAGTYRVDVTGMVERTLSVSDERGRLAEDVNLSHEKQLVLAHTLKDKGYSNAGIAHIMRISESTVRTLLAS